MRDGFAVAAHGVDGAIKLFGLQRIFVCKGPVPVRLWTRVAAFFAQDFVIDKGKVAVPVEEGALSMQVSR